MARGSGGGRGRLLWVFQGGLRVGLGGCVLHGEVRQLEKGGVPGVSGQRRVGAPWTPLKLRALVDMFLVPVQVVRVGPEEAPKGKGFLLVDSGKFLTPAGFSGGHHTARWGRAQLPHMSVVAVLGALGLPTPGASRHPYTGAARTPRHHVGLLFRVHTGVVRHIPGRPVIHKILRHSSSSETENSRLNGFLRRAFDAGDECLRLYENAV